MALVPVEPLPLTSVIGCRVVRTALRPFFDDVEITIANGRHICQGSIASGVVKRLCERDFTTPTLLDRFCAVRYTTDLRFVLVNSDNRVIGLLDGYRALDLTDEKGFICGKVLADLGADVVKIEVPGGDSSRRIGPHIHDIPGADDSLYWLAYNASKKGITLDLSTGDGQEIFKKLVKTADFVIESFAPGDASGLGNITRQSTSRRWGSPGKTSCGYSRQG